MSKEIVRVARRGTGKNAYYFVECTEHGILAETFSVTKASKAAMERSRQTHLAKHKSEIIKRYDW